MVVVRGRAAAAAAAAATAATPTSTVLIASMIHITDGNYDADCPPVLFIVADHIVASNRTIKIRLG